MNLKHYILDVDNNAVETDLITWAMWYERSENRVVAWTQITSKCLVSTVFLGIDHRYFGGGPPLLFETKIFGGPRDEYLWRYSSWDDAQTGHRTAVRKAREAIGQKVPGHED